MTGSAQQARQALAVRLRELRKDAGLTARALADMHGWPRSKMSKIELGQQMPTENDIRLWCQSCNSEDQIPDLIATMRGVQAAYLEIQYMRLPVRQRKSIAWESETKLTRWYEPWVVPGLLQTPAYAETVIGRCLDFYQGSHSDVAATLAARLERQQVLYRGDHRFHFIIAEHVLHATFAGTDTMAGQLDRLLVAMSLPRIVLGVIPTDTECLVPQTNFHILDRKKVLVESVTAELTISQPREIVLYEKAFRILADHAVVGAPARNLITAAIHTRR